MALNQITPSQLPTSASSIDPNVTSSTDTTNTTNRLSRLTSIMREIGFAESQLARQQFDNCQSAIQTNTKTEVDALNRQGYVHLGIAAIRAIFLGVSIAGTALTASQPPQVGAATATLTFQSMPSSRLSDVLAKTLSAAKEVFKKLPHEQLPRFADALGEAAILPEKILQGKITQANAEIRKAEMRSQIKQQDQSRALNAAEELYQAYRSLANSVFESMRAR